MKHRLQTLLKHKLQWLVLLTALLGVSQGVWADNSVVSDGTYRLYVQFSGGDDWWNGSGKCYHYAWVWHSGRGGYVARVYKVGTTNCKNTDSTTDYFYLSLPSDSNNAIDRIIFLRGKEETDPSNGSTTWSDKYYNKTGDITISSDITTYNLITGIRGNNASCTQTDNYAIAPSSCSVEITGAQSGTGTQGDPYIVNVGEQYTLTLSAACDDGNLTKYYTFDNSNWSTTATKNVTPAVAGTTPYSNMKAKMGNGSGTVTYSSAVSASTIYVQAVDACTPPAAPTAVSLSSLSPAAASGTGTSADPYMVKKNTTYAFAIASTLSNSQTGFVATVNNASSAGGTSATSGNTASINATSPTNYDTKTEYTLRSWAYQGSTSCLSSSAASTSVYLKTCPSAPAGTAQANGTSSSISVSNGSSVTISLSNPSASSVTWKKSTNGGSTWVDTGISPSGDDYHFNTGALTQPTKYKAIISNACGDTSESIVTVNTSTVVYVNVSAVSWTNVKIYGWDSGDSPVFGTWTGTDMTSLGGNYYSYETTNTTVSGIIINNNGDGNNQTANASITVGSKNCYTVSSSTDGSGHRTISGPAAGNCPSEFTSVTVDETAAVCVGSTVTLTKSSDPNTSVTWSFSSDDTDVATVTSAGVVTGKAAGTATITATASKSGYISKSATCTVTVNALPSTPSITSYDEYVCSGAAPTFTFSSTSGLVYQMYVGGSTSGDDITGDGSSKTLTADDIDEETTFTLRATNSTTGCYSSSSGATVGITPDMALTSITLTPSNICVGGISVASETGLELGGGSIEYTASPAAKVSIDDREITGVAVADGITITATVSGGCGSDPDPKTATLNVKAAPTAYTLSASGESEAYICSAGGTLTLSGSQSGYSYQLKKDGSASGTAKTGTGSALEFTVYESGDYTCEAYLTGSPDCKTSMTGTVTLHLSLTPNLLPATPTVRNFEPVVITSINTDIETWTITNGGEAVTDRTAYLYNITSNSATVKALKAASSYTVTATTSGGCSNTVTVTAVDYAETCN